LLRDQDRHQVQERAGRRIPFDETIARIVKKTGRSEADARLSLTSMSPQGRLVQPAEVAHAVAMLCDEGARGIHGQTIVMDGGQVMK
jgi:NAD(P)-dependent dehydrogenase (short-subunit alcohol dehydrogenase family)